MSYLLDLENDLDLLDFEIKSKSQTYKPKDKYKEFNQLAHLCKGKAKRLAKIKKARKKAKENI